MKETIMTDIDNVPLPPEPPLREPGQENGRNGGFTWPRAFAMAGVLAAGLALGAGGFAVAAAGIDHLGWKHGAHLAFVQGAVSRALDSVGANAAQEAKVHDIIATKFAEIAPNPGDHEALRKQALDLLAAPTVDRAAVEKLRADVVATFDAKSKLVVGGLLDIADQLTPAQRVQLTSEIEEMAQRGPMMGPWGGARYGRPMDESPNGAPDSAPDKD
jgi:Spy/CpxP family protein refolding chaperone